MENIFPVTNPPVQESAGIKKNMKQLVAICILLILTAIGLILFSILKKPAIVPENISINKISMILTSPAFKNDTIIPAKYTCDGTNVNPPLKFFAVPENTVSLVLIVDDPDAPSGNWTHWLLWNIDPSAQSIEEGIAPAGAVQGLTDFSANSYGGPCPPSGNHHYNFKLYALDTALNLPPHSGKEDLTNAMQGHVLAEAKLTGLYSR